MGKKASQNPDRQKNPHPLGEYNNGRGQMNFPEERIPSFWRCDQEDHFLGGQPLTSVLEGL